MKAIRGSWLGIWMVLLAGSTPADEPAKVPPPATQTAPQLHERGNELRGRGQYGPALDCYRRALELDPKLAACFVDRALLWCDQRNTQAALADCDRALELKPKYPRAYNIRGL